MSYRSSRWAKVPKGLSSWIQPQVVDDDIHSGQHLFAIDWQVLYKNATVDSVLPQWIVSKCMLNIKDRQKLL